MNANLHATLTTFEVGKSYVHGWICDADLKTVYRVLSRTAKQLTIQQGSSPAKRVGIKVLGGVETCAPSGRYSMSPTLRADKEVRA